MQENFLGRTRISKSWLFSPPLHGTQAAAVAIAGILIPTLIRLNMSPGIDDQACTIFCPAVLTVSILCGWRYALATAVGSAIACNTVVMGSPYEFHFTRAEFEGLGTFLAYCVFMIAVVRLFRETAARSLRQAAPKRMRAAWFSVSIAGRCGRAGMVWMRRCGLARRGRSS